MRSRHGRRDSTIQVSFALSRSCVVCRLVARVDCPFMRSWKLLFWADVVLEACVCFWCLTRDLLPASNTCLTLVFHLSARSG